MEAVQTEQYKGYVINIYQDEDAESPQDWDNFGHMICFHKNYILGDKHNLSVEELKDIVAHKDVISLPLYLYDHSGISMSIGRQYPFDDPWDAGQVGYIYVDYKDIMREYKEVNAETIAKAIALLKIEVITYNQYLTGDVYGYIVKNKQGDMIASCWGFFGREGIEDAIRDCKDIVDSDIAREHKLNTQDHTVEVCCYDQGN